MKPTRGKIDRSVIDPHLVPRVVIPKCYRIHNQDVKHSLVRILGRAKIPTSGCPQPHYQVTFPALKFARCIVMSKQSAGVLHDQSGDGNLVDSDEKSVFLNTVYHTIYRGSCII